ncbi:hypothetical protein BD309DRAFT_302671 [Dichomitus squalens]|nr:hypothetical protein BD309DRAFT_302671 [Dichomitus squalens]
MVKFCSVLVLRMLTCTTRFSSMATFPVSLFTCGIRSSARLSPVRPRFAALRPPHALRSRDLLEAGRSRPVVTSQVPFGPRFETCGLTASMA